MLTVLNANCPNSPTTSRFHFNSTRARADIPTASLCALRELYVNYSIYILFLRAFDWHIYACEFSLVYNVLLVTFVPIIVFLYSLHF